VLIALALAVASGGCGKKNKTPTGPIGDTGGEHLLTFTTTRASGTTSEYDVVLYDVDLHVYRSVAGLNNTYSQSEPCLSNDGNFIAFASNRPSGLGGLDVYVYKRETQELVATPGLNSAADESYPRFTYDSVRLAFVRDSSTFERIHLYEPTGDSLLPLPGLGTGAYSDNAPSPDLHGDRIAFQSDRSGVNHVYVWDRASGVLSLPALVGDQNDVEPSLSANGRWLAFASDRSGGAGGYDIYLYDLQTSSFVPLPRLNTADDERHPSVSSDGKAIFFTVIPTGANGDIWGYTLPDSAIGHPANLANPADDREPYLRWR
jgi:Tol biopolymer transport system component